jgi:putative transposase
MIRYHGYSERRACRLSCQARGTYRWESRKDSHTALRIRMNDIAKARVRYGYRRIQVLLNREGWNIGKKLAYRIYTEEGLTLRHAGGRKRRRMAVQRTSRYKPNRVNEVWSMDFVSDQLANGIRFRALTVIDIYSREALAIEVGQHLRGYDVVQTLNRLVSQRGKPKYLFTDNGPEFSGQMLDLWAYHYNVRIDFSRLGKPTDNAYIETFNGSLREECLNINWFESLNDAREIIEAWRKDYNESRPHMALGNLTPLEYIRIQAELKEIVCLQTT